jgi:hypothetical protein
MADMVHLGREPEMAGESPEPPAIVYRHSIHLDEEDLKALGIEDMPTAGTEFHLEGIGTVCHASTSDFDADGDVDGVCVSLTLTHMGAEFGDSPALKDKDKDYAKSLYGR